jgi:hypothetical protein
MVLVSGRVLLLLMVGGGLQEVVLLLMLLVVGALPVGFFHLLVLVGGRLL